VSSQQSLVASEVSLSFSGKISFHEKIYNQKKKVERKEKKASRLDISGQETVFFFVK